jgi:beta-glucanase (GH16 family)
LNLAVGGNWPGNPDDTTIFPQHMLVDYVRVYSRNPETSEATTKSGAPYIDSDVWASSEGRPFLKFAAPPAITSRPTR